MSNKKKAPCVCGSGKKYRDCCGLKNRAPIRPSFWSFLWAPTVLFVAVAAYVLLRSTQAHNYPQYAFWVQNDTLNALSWGCFILAVLLAVLPPLRRSAVGHLERLKDAPTSVHALWLFLGFVGVLGWFCFIRFCQYRAYLLPTDTTNDVNAAYTFLHYRVLEYSTFGVKILSIHFFLLMAPFSLILLLWNDPLALLFLQNLFICSAPFAMYALVVRLTASPMAGFAGLTLTLSSPFLYELLTSNLHNAALCAFLPWAMFCVYLRRWFFAAVFMALMICSVEQVPFIFFGMGLYAIHALRDRSPKNWFYGLGISFAAAGLWLFEMSVIKHYGRHEMIANYAGSGYAEMFRPLVPSNTPVDHILQEVILHPIRTFIFLFSSAYRFYPMLRVLFSMGFLCLLAPAAMIPFLTTIFPHVLSNSDGRPVSFFDYHPLTYADFGLHHSSYIFGPLIWATALGIRKAYGELAPRGRQGWILVWALAFSGFGFKYAHRTLHPNWRPNWFDTMPQVMARIPPGSRVWADEYASPPLSNRRWIQVTQWGPGEPAGWDKLFKPDYVLLDKAFIVHGKPPYRDKLLTYLAQKGYAKDVEAGSVVLLKAPEVSAHPEEDIPAWFQLPAPDTRLAQQFGRYILDTMSGASPGNR